MKYRDINEGGDLFSILEHQSQVALNKKGINRLNDVVDWEMFREPLEEILGYNKRDVKKGGRPPFDPVFMFKVLVLQKFYGLSDEGTEHQIEDRFSFMKFLRLQPGDQIPDCNTIWDFRESLEQDGRNGSELLFNRFNELLEQEHIIGREGSIVDASFVEAPRQRNTRAENESIKEGQRPEGFKANVSKNRQKDCDARWAKKNNETYYGYKNHAKVDAKSKVVIGYCSTSASVHDSQVFKDLVGPEDNAVFADSAYCSDESESYILNDCDAQDFIMLKAQRNKPLSDEDKATNKLRSRIRVRVEHVFGRLKQMGANYFRCIGMTRAHQHNGMSNLVYNLDRYAFLCTLPSK